MVVVSSVVDINKTGMNETVSSGCDVVRVIKEAVILSAIVAQKPITIFTIPYSLVALMIISMAEVTAMDFL